MKRLILLFAIALNCQACNPVNFNTGKDTAQNQPGTPAVVPASCTENHVESILRVTKLLFMVDTSGSNVETTMNYCGTGYCSTPPTDPDKAFRGGAISDFLARFRHKTNFQWSFATFAGTSAKALVNDGYDQHPLFAADPNAMQLALNSFMQITDHGATPYKAAIDMAARAIQADPDRNAASHPNYFVILLTDGFPTDYYDSNGVFQSSAINHDIDLLLNTAPGQVNLSTIYYGKVNDPNAINLLRTIAQMGGGQFASVNDVNSGFKIDDVIPGVTSACP